MTLTIEQQANRWVVRESQQGLDAAEQAALDAWCSADARHLGAYVRARVIHKRLDRVAGQQSPSTTATVTQAVAEPAEVPAPQGWRPALKRGLRYAALAAGLAAVFVATSLFTEPRTVSIATAVGEFRRVPLADQSIAHINSASEIDVVLTEHLREVTLKKGEAWFEVAKDKSRPFVVSAGDARVRAVGTSFSVHRHVQGAEILVTEGVVEVWRNGSAHKWLVSAGERAELPERGSDVAIARQPEEIARLLSWREGKLVLSNQELGLAVAEFNRYTRKPIVISDPRLVHRPLAGQYPVDDPEQFARAIGALLNVPVAITHDRIIVGDVRLLNAANSAH